ncbi:hypothetical protein LFZ31_21785, partial [Salmonella enterica subsp. enterica serovar Newport str. S09097]
KKGWASGSIVPVNNASIHGPPNVARGQANIMHHQQGTVFRHPDGNHNAEKGRVAPLPTNPYLATCGVSF